MRTLRLHTAKSRRALKPSSFAATRRDASVEADVGSATPALATCCRYICALLRCCCCCHKRKTECMTNVRLARGCSSHWRDGCVAGVSSRYKIHSRPVCQAPCLPVGQPACWPGRGAIYTSVNCLASCPTAASGISNAATNFKLNAKRFRLLAQPSSILYLVYCILYLVASILYLCIWHRLSCV